MDGYGASDAATKAMLFIVLAQTLLQIARPVSERQGSGGVNHCQRSDEMSQPAGDRLLLRDEAADQVDGWWRESYGFGCLRRSQLS